ncbi:MAG: hypothetical protein JST85_01055 [Acidobacteria bacterium]|nr:hypothetical protein [Acidobacteriota bacterium]
MNRRIKTASNVVSNGQGQTQAAINGHENGKLPDLSVLLSSLQAMRNGDFSVRLPGSWTGLEGKIADTVRPTLSTR